MKKNITISLYDNSLVLEGTDVSQRKNDEFHQVIVDNPGLAKGMQALVNCIINASPALRKDNPKGVKFGQLVKITLL